MKILIAKTAGFCMGVKRAVDLALENAGKTPGGLKNALASFPDVPLITADYELAAEFFNKLQQKGVQGSNTDFLICAVAVRNKFAIYSTDKDFDLFSKHIPIVMYRPEKHQAFHD